MHFFFLTACPARSSPECQLLRGKYMRALTCVFCCWKIGNNHHKWDLFVAASRFSQGLSFQVVKTRYGSSQHPLYLILFFFLRFSSDLTQVFRFRVIISKTLLIRHLRKCTINGMDDVKLSSSADEKCNNILPVHRTLRALNEFPFWNVNAVLTIYQIHLENYQLIVRPIYSKTFTAKMIKSNLFKSFCIRSSPIYK